MTDERFSVVYRLTGDEAGALEKAQTICLEQTVELSAELVPERWIHQRIIGRIERFTALQQDRYEAEISYPVETTAFELTQLLNVIFGNSSIKAGIRIEHLDLSPSLAARFPGPRFGIAGLRKAVGVYDRPLLCSALKPMGKSPEALAQLAYQFALGGIDLIKDDHGLTAQPFCPFQERVAACARAVAKANAETGKQCLYIANVTAPAPLIRQRAQWAQQAGAGGLLLAPGLTGFDSLRGLAEDEQLDLPILSHPAWLGSFVINPDSGVAHGVLFGELQRLAGADASIYPNYGGRFGFSRAECAAIAERCRAPYWNYLPIFPTPGGGMTLEKIPELLDLYGNDVLFLMGGGLYGRSPDLAENARYFVALVSR